MVVNIEDLTKYKGELGLGLKVGLSNVFIQCENYIVEKNTYCYCKMKVSLIDSMLFNCGFHYLVILL